jgi:carbamoyltransferase
MNNEKFYLGISLGFNSSACVYSDQRGLLAAVSQERLNGEKNTKELPFDAILACCKIANTNVINEIAIAHYEKLSDEYFHKYGKRFNLTGKNYEEFIYNFLVDNNITVVDKCMWSIDHHTAHGFSTYGFYGVPVDSKHYLITSDGFGHGKSATIIFDEKELSHVKLKNSVALVYQFVTGALGFKEHQHEGKITGLAAFGKPIYMNEFEDLYTVAITGNHLEFKSDEYELTEEEIEKCKTSMIEDFDEFLKVKKAVYGLVNNLVEKGAKREDIAATVQEFAELYTLAWIREYCEPGYDAYIAGGLFANVKINQRIKDLKDYNGNRFFRNVYVCPGMGDEGTCVGAAIFAAKTKGIEHKVENASRHVISGTIANEAEVEYWFNELCENKSDYKIKILDDSIDYISNKLAENKIVCLVRDQMEFGPRALCHRSILYNADSRETNDWLNKKLSRTEFMPFAPVTREEVADDLFINLDGGRDSAKFMTMTFDCTEEFAENYKAACHIDNTARPQIISKSDDEYMWNILKKYQELTGKKAMINTSFNLHNNPIIESVKVAIDSWIKSDTDVLVIGNYCIEKR